MNIIKAEKRHIQYLKGLYRRAFPKQERKPFWLMRRQAKKGLMELWVIEEEGPAGMAFVMRAGDLVLLDYFAIDEACRGKGLGSQALDGLRELYKDKRFLLEIETPDDAAPNNAQRKKRKAFYLKNNMKEAGIRASVFGTEMELLCWNCGDKAVNFEEYQQYYL